MRRKQLFAIALAGVMAPGMNPAVYVPAEELLELGSGEEPGTEDAEAAYAEDAFETLIEVTEEEPYTEEESWEAAETHTGSTDGGMGS